MIQSTNVYIFFVNGAQFEKINEKGRLLMSTDNLYKLSFQSVSGSNMIMVCAYDFSWQATSLYFAYLPSATLLVVNTPKISCFYILLIANNLWESCVGQAGRSCLSGENSIALRGQFACFCPTIDYRLGTKRMLLIGKKPCF